MNTADIVILIIVGIGFYFGYKKGFLYQLSSLLGFTIAYLFTGNLFMYVHQFLTSEGYLTVSSSKWISYILTFIGIILIVRLITKAIVTFLKTIGLNFVNKFAGGLLGALKWYLFLSLVIYALYDLKIFQVESLRNSSLLSFTELVGESLINWLVAK